MAYLSVPIIQDVCILFRFVGDRVFFFSVRTHGFQGNVAEERDVVRWWQDDVTEFGKLTMFLIGE